MLKFHVEDFACITHSIKLEIYENGIRIPEFWDSLSLLSGEKCTSLQQEKEMRNFLFDSPTTYTEFQSLGVFLSKSTESFILNGGIPF